MKLQRGHCRQQEGCSMQLTHLLVRQWGADPETQVWQVPREPQSNMIATAYRNLPMRAFYLSKIGVRRDKR
jgi:hypothetical protein